MILPRVGLENSWLQSRRCALAFSLGCLYSIQNFSFQVFPIGRAVPTPAVPLGCQTVPVSSVREEVRPQRPPVQTHQSPPFSTNQPDSSHCKLMLGGARISGKPSGSDALTLTRTQATGAGGRGRECTGVGAFRQVDRGPSAEARLVLSFRQTVIVK